MKGRQVDRLSQSVSIQGDYTVDKVSSTSDAYCARSTHNLNHRTVAEIQEKVAEKGARGLLSRLTHMKNDRDVMATWRSDLNRVLHVFNVCSAASVQQLLTTITPQTELAIGTHMVISDTHAMVLDLHCNVLIVQGGTDGQHYSLSVAPNPSAAKHLPSSRLKPG